MKTFILLTEKPWHESLFRDLKEFFADFNWILITNKASFSEKTLETLKPEKIFIPHWSHIIPKEIYTNFECIVFHMTDLPYGRGGSPLQNLIVRGHKITKVSALKATKGIDEGDIYLKKDLSLEGSAGDIFSRSSDIIFEMIKEIISKNPTPVPQNGEPVLFKRRKPEEGNLKDLTSIEEVYDFIRMLDGEGYPCAFLETQEFKYEFSNARLKSNNQIFANVTITKK